MNIKGLDRVVIMVRDMNKALQLFSKTLGMEFQELDPIISARDGTKSYVCHQANLHLVSPIMPLGKNVPPPMRKRIALLETQEAVFNALTFMVDNVANAESELKQMGNNIQHRYSPSADYDSIGMRNFCEVVTNEQDTLGITLGFASYDRTLSGLSPERKPGQNQGPGSYCHHGKRHGQSAATVFWEARNEIPRAVTGYSGTRWKQRMCMP